MRLPRDISGDDLIKMLAKVGYTATRTTGSHVRLSRITDQDAHHVTIPLHKNIRVGTLNNILSDVGSHLNITRQELLKLL